MNKIWTAAALGLAATCLDAQWLKQPTVGIPRTPDGKPNLSAPAPKMSDGKPDLSGIWTLTQTGGGLGTLLKPTEIKPWAEALHKQRVEDLGNDSPGILCLPSGFAGGGLVKIVQTPGLIVMLNEDLTYRQIFLDGRDLPSDPNPAWMGYSVAKWEGDTLVVESTGYNDRTWVDQGYPHTENLHMTERIRRGDFGHLKVDITFRDPAIYEKPWTVEVGGLYSADTELIEYVCAENEKDRVHLVGKNSDDTKNAIKLAPEILSQYVGSYVLNAKELGIPGPETIELKVVLEGDTLKLGMGDGPKGPLTPLSETKFAAIGAQVEFGKNEKGEVTHITFTAAEGDFRANRKN
jgi:hypothetical protein